MASTRKSRLILFENGAALGVFSHEGIRGKHSSHGATTLVVEPSGTAFTQVQEDGSCLRQLSDYCKHDLLPQLSVLTAFRNLHSGRPYLLARSSRTEREEITCATTTITTPREPHVMSVPGVTDHPRNHHTLIGHPRHRTPKYARSTHLPNNIVEPPNDYTTLSGAYNHYGGETRSNDATDSARISPPSRRKEDGVGTNGAIFRRRRNFREVSKMAVWPARADYKSGQYCTIGADGSVEVRAVGGNARLTLSALRSLVEVDFATSSSTTTDDADCASYNSGKSEPRFDVRSGSRKSGLRNIGSGDRFSSMSPPTFPSAARSGSCNTVGGDVGMDGGIVAGGGSAARRAACRGGDSKYRRPAERRVWVTRQFLVCNVPPEFAHPLAVALSVGVGHPAGPCVEGRGGDQGDSRAEDRRRRALESGGGRDDGERAHVLCRLPLPEEMPDHPRWDTIKGAWTQSVYYGEHRHLIGQLYPTETFRSSGADADAKSPHLLAVDALDLSHGDGYHGTLAATVETVHGCTYRIVHDHSVGGEGRHGVDGINVHVVVHADGSEVLLEGDFIRILRAASRTNPRPESRVLHVSATSTVRLDIAGVASTPPSPPPPAPSADATERRTPAERNGGTLTGADPSAPTAARSYSGSDVSSPRASALHSAVAKGHRDGRISVGDITARAQAFRQQFVSWTTCRRSGENRADPSEVPATKSCPRICGGGVGCTRSIVGNVGYGRLGAGGGDADAHIVFGGTKNIPKLGSGVQRAMTTTTADPQMSFVPLLMPAGCFGGLEARSEDITGKITGNRRYDHHNCETSCRSQPVASTCKNLPDPTKVVERVERSGASFVLFADGRSRGVFADRTIVRLPAPSDCSVPDGGGEWLWPGAADGHVPNAGGARVTALGVVGSGCYSCSGGRRLSERVGSDLVDCILPDGTEVRLTSHCFSRRQCHGKSDGSICSRAKALKPYVLAVRRFADWAAAEPQERRARSEESERTRRAAAVEAEKNRRFVTLRRLQQQRSFSSDVLHSSAKCPSAKQDITSPVVGGENLTPARRDRGHERTPLGTQAINVPPPVVVTPDAKSMDTLQEKTAEDLQGEQAISRQERRVKFIGHSNDTSSNSNRNGRDGCVSRGLENGDHGDKYVLGSSRGMVGNVGTTSVGTRERNEIVRRVLEANRQILLGPAASCSVAMLRGMR